MSTQALPLAAGARPTCRYDLWLLGTAVALLALGVVMVGSASMAIVITSYSIHYTKLYDSAGRPHRGAAAIGGQCEGDPMMAAEQMTRRHLLSELLEGMALVLPGQDRPITGLTLDSRRVAPGDLFLAVAGGSRHGGEFAAQAVTAGAAAIAWVV